MDTIQWICVIYDCIPQISQSQSEAIVPWCTSALLATSTCHPLLNALSFLFFLLNGLYPMCNVQANLYVYIWAGVGLVALVEKVHHPSLFNRKLGDSSCPHIAPFVQ
jgi:hypothetical protein